MFAQFLQAFLLTRLCETSFFPPDMQSALAYGKYLNHFLEWCRVFANVNVRVRNVKT